MSRIKGPFPIARSQINHFSGIFDPKTRVTSKGVWSPRKRLIVATVILVASWGIILTSRYV